MNKYIALVIFSCLINASAQQVTITDKEAGGSTSIGLTGSSVKQGEKISEEVLKSFQTGLTTYEELIGKLGKPSSISQSKGYTMLTYSSTNASTKVDAIKFVPILGSLFGSTKMTAESQVLTFIFDANNILMSIQDSSIKGSGEEKGLIDRFKRSEVKIE